MSMIFGSVSKRVGTTFHIHFLHLEHFMPGQFKELYQQNYNRQKGFVCLFIIFVNFIFLVVGPEGPPRKILLHTKC